MEKELQLRRDDSLEMKVSRFIGVLSIVVSVVTIWFVIVKTQTF